MTDWMLNCNKDTLYLNVRSHSITPQIHLNCTACIITGIVCFHHNTLIKSITSGPLLFKPHIYVSGGIKYYVCFFKKKKKTVIINTQRVKIWIRKCILVGSTSRNSFIYSVRRSRRHLLLYVGVVMSSCSPLVMLLMGINTIIWITNTN